MASAVLAVAWSSSSRVGAHVVAVDIGWFLSGYLIGAGAAAAKLCGLRFHVWLTDRSPLGADVRVAVGFLAVAHNPVAAVLGGHRPRRALPAAGVATGGIHVQRFLGLWLGHRVLVHHLQLLGFVRSVVVDPGHVFAAHLIPLPARARLGRLQRPGSAGTGLGCRRWRRWQTAMLASTGLAYLCLPGSCLTAYGRAGNRRPPRCTVLAAMASAAGSQACRARRRPIPSECTSARALPAPWRLLLRGPLQACWPVAAGPTRRHTNGGQWRGGRGVTMRVFPDMILVTNQSGTPRARPIRRSEWPIAARALSLSRVPAASTSWVFQRWRSCSGLPFRFGFLVAAGCSGGRSGCALDVSAG